MYMRLYCNDIQSLNTYKYKLDCPPMEADPCRVIIQEGIVYDEIYIPKQWPFYCGTIKGTNGSLPLLYTDIHNNGSDDTT